MMNPAMPNRKPEPRAIDDLTVEEAASKRLSAWIAAIADLVKNPVAGLGSALEIVGREITKAAAGESFDDKTATDAIGLMRSRLAKLDNDVTELIDFAKPTRIIPQWTPAEQLIGDSIKRASNDLPGRVQTNIKTAPGVHLIFGDPAKLEAILSALLRNAIEATLKVEHPNVRLQAFHSIHPFEGHLARGITVAVSDNGSGMDPQFIAEAMLPFFSTKEAGTGLGLAVADKYARAHGGHLEITRCEDLGGTKASLFLPQPMNEPNINHSAEAP